MTEHLSILIIEDSVNDAELVAHQLLKIGCAVSWERVETSNQMKAALQKQP